MVKAVTPPTYDEEEQSRPRCPDCGQPLTFVRTKSHQKRWYCYSCEKYTDHIAQPALEKNTKTQIETMSGLQVIDSHGMIVGRVRKIIPAGDTGDLRAFVLSVDKEQLKNLLDQRGQPREFEVGHDKVATIGDVVLLSEVFSPRAFAPPPPKPSDETRTSAKRCGKCGSPLLADAKYCIKCGASVSHSNNCVLCGTPNPSEALFCMSCGNRLS